MSNPDKTAGAEGAPAPRANARPEARLPKGMRDIGAAELRQQREMIEKVRAVYERYGFEPLETPAFEYTDALGKFLPDQDRPNEGVFSFQDVAPEAREQGGSGQWLSLRYDLTAPLARYYAENAQSLPKPFRRYAVGPVWRNEKPGPGRFRQFMQFDADTVGAESVAADAEMCMLAADTMEALGISRGDYVIKVNSRKVLDGLRDGIGLRGPENDARWLTVMRALDKFDRLGWKGVEALLGEGRTDESGDRTTGAKLSTSEIADVRAFLDQRIDDDEFSGVSLVRPSGLASMRDNASYQEGLADLIAIKKLCRSAGFDSQRVRLDLTVVRGLEYYTGPVFEAELTFEVKDDEGRPVRFGSVGGGGRYDGLVERFTGEKVPATGFSIGVSRLQAALAALNKSASSAANGPVVVLVMADEKGKQPDYARFQRLVQRLRQPEDGGPPIRAEMYLGSSGMNAQVKYADKRGSPCVVIQGGDELQRGEVTLKDLIEGAKAAAAIKDNKEWKQARPGQVSVKEADLVAEARKILARHST